MHRKLPLAVIGVPSSAGARGKGVEESPASLRTAGLIEGLRGLGLAVHDEGDLPRVEFQADHANPRQRNRTAVRGVARAVAERVGTVRAGGARPLVLGGDCTITLGVISGLVREGPDLGLVYFDGDLDLNTPATSPSGFLDGMVTAHIFGGGVPELATLGPRYPLLPARQVAFVGYNPDSGFVDPPEMDALARSGALAYPIDLLRRDSLAAAHRALAAIEARAGRFLVHFDVDVSDLPAVHVPHPDALAWDEAAGVLRTFVSSEQCVGLVLTELDPRRDPDGHSMPRVVRSIVEAFRP